MTVKIYKNFFLLLSPKKVAAGQMIKADQQIQRTAFSNSRSVWCKSLLTSALLKLHLTFRSPLSNFIKETEVAANVVKSHFKSITSII